MTGASRFNTKPKTGLAFLEENKLIYTDPNEPRAVSLAKFLKNSARIDKRLLGDFISRPDNIDVLKAFMMLFDFKGVRPCTTRLLHSSRADSLTETCIRGIAGAVGELPPSWRVSADQSYHGNVR